MKFTSINISNSNHTFKYIIEYKQNNIEKCSDNYSYSVFEDNIYICHDQNNWKHNNNVWEKVDFNGIKLTGVKTANITLYFPNYSVETYTKNVNYAITANIWVNNKCVYLGTFIVNRIDSLAADKIYSFYNQKYYECFTFEIPDPQEIIYSEIWKTWRTNVCNSLISNDIELNNDSTILNFTLHPVTKSGNIYTKCSEYDGGQNSIRFNENNYNLHYNLSVDKSQYPCIHFNSIIQFNTEYSQTSSGFKEYLKETYDIDNCVFRYDYYIQDKENVYGYYSKYVDGHKCELTKYDIYNSEFPITSWDSFIEGLYIVSSLNIIDINNIDNEEGILMTIMSNQIPLTDELYKFFIIDNLNDVDFIKLNLVDMKVYEINAVNKIEKNIIQVERPKDYKNNLTKPIYYRTRELGNVIFHPSVTENICINLDSYKSHADSFILKLEGINFKEQARVSNGVIFKIVGNMLPAKINSGTYYILNQDNDLITTGKYTYEV